MNHENIELNESKTHSEVVEIVTESLDSEGISYETEKQLDDSSRVDVFYDGIVVEVKSSVGVIDHDKLARYREHSEVREVVLCLPEPRAERIETGDYRVLSIPTETYTFSP